MEAIEKQHIYEQAGSLVAEDTEESLEQAMLLYRSISGWQDADRKYIFCRTRLGRMRWKVESSRLKEYEDRFEHKVTRWKKTGLTVLIAVLLIIAVITTVSLLRLSQYNKAAEFFTAGEYDRSADAFMQMGNYRDSRTRLYLSAVELYRAKRYEDALRYFTVLDGAFDNGFYLQKCRERLLIQDTAVSER